MNCVRTVFVLSCLLWGGWGSVFTQSEPCPSATCSIGLLEPGSTLEGLDGIVVDAAKAQLDKPLTVYVERIEDISGLLELSQNPDSPLKAETAYYRIGATEQYRTDGTFLLYVPLPEDAPTENLAVFSLSTTEGSPEGIPSPDSTGETASDDVIYIGWASFPATYVPERNAVVFGRGLLKPEGSIFTIVSGAYRK
jgi:hypothetical protein